MWDQPPSLPTPTHGLRFTPVLGNYHRRVREGNRPPSQQPPLEETSAGGLVVDPNPGPPRVALIGRRGRAGGLMWSLPKGHVEAGESPEQAAVREIAEETGIHGRVVRPIGAIDYWFVTDGQRIHKTVHHFLLRATGGELSADDIEVEQAAWVPLDEVADRLAFANERALVLRAVEKAVDVT